MRVCLATCRVLPEPDPDQQLLIAALAAAGGEARLLPWDDPAASAAGADLCVIRSTWNYYERREAFLRWIDEVGRATRVLNPPAVIGWNTDKSYLVELARRGLPVVPTVLLEPGAAVSLARLMDEHGWREVVVKPRVSAGSFATRRFARRTLPEGERFLRDWLGRRAMIVQPYLRSVEGYGERALVWIDGELTHAVRKSPRFLGEDEQVTAGLPLAADERRLAGRVLEGIDADLLYARVDLARDEDGAPLLMELELVEPSLFLAQSPVALERLVQAIVRHAGSP